MSRTSRTLLCGIAALGLAGTAQAQGATRPFSVGISGGLSIPTGDAGDALESGFNVGGLLQARQAAGPLGFRAEVGYHSFDFKGVDGDFRVITGIVNGIFHFASASGAPITPYLIAGVGAYNGRASVGGGGRTVSSDSETDLGINGGVGFDIPLSGIATFIEARYHTIFNEGDRTNLIPITVGIRF